MHLRASFRLNLFEIGYIFSNLVEVRVLPSFRVKVFRT